MKKAEGRQKGELAISAAYPLMLRRRSTSVKKKKTKHAEDPGKVVEKERRSCTIVHVSRTIFCDAYSVWPKLIGYPGIVSFNLEKKKKGKGGGLINDLFVQHLLQGSQNGGQVKRSHLFPGGC